MLPFVLLASAAVLAENLPAHAGERPACKSGTAGLMWPLEANENPRLVHKLAREGSLWICSWGRWRYQWRQPVVPVRALKPASEPQGAGKARPLAEAASTEP